MEKTKISTLIFDWGGVIVHNKIGKAVHNELLNTVGCKNLPSEEEFQKILEDIDILEDLSGFVAEINKGFNIELSLKAIKIIFRKVIKYYPEVIDFIKEAKTKYRIILLSNNHYINVENMKIYKKVIFEIFDEVYFSCEYGIKKPNPEFYKLPLKDFNLKPEECIFIDDKEENIEGAKKLKFNTIIHTDLEHLKEQLKEFNVKI